MRRTSVLPAGKTLPQGGLTPPEDVRSYGVPGRRPACWGVPGGLVFRNDFKFRHGEFLQTVFRLERRGSARRRECGVQAFCRQLYRDGEISCPRTRPVFLGSPCQKDGDVSHLRMRPTFSTAKKWAKRRLGVSPLRTPRFRNRVVESPLLQTVSVERLPTNPGTRPTAPAGL